tara:strand:+ start:4643 stop:5929 length:1287 start_codon:yes stop_codon:yes gene_type:complete
MTTINYLKAAHVTRDLEAGLLERLDRFPCVCLYGLKKVGKSTLADIIGKTSESVTKLVLNDPSDRDKLIDDPDFFQTHTHGVIIVDEAQNKPEVFDLIKNELARCRFSSLKPGRFVILGSASMEVRKFAHVLAGDCSRVEVVPLSAPEVSRHFEGQRLAVLDIPTTPAGPVSRAPSSLATSFDQFQLWCRGGLPDSVFAKSDRDSLEWRKEYISAYLDRAPPTIGLTASPTLLRRFLDLLALNQGETWKLTTYTSSLAANKADVENCIEVLTNFGFLARLSRWSTIPSNEITDPPRYYLRDSGIHHAILGLESESQLRAAACGGKSWESFVIGALMQSARVPAKFSYFNHGGDVELDLVVEFESGKKWAVEIKLSPDPKINEGNRLAAEAIQAERRIVVHGGSGSFRKKWNFEAMSLLKACAEFSAMS